MFEVAIRVAAEGNTHLVSGDPSILIERYDRRCERDSRATRERPVRIRERREVQIQLSPERFSLLGVRSVDDDGDKRFVLSASQVLSPEPFELRERRRAVLLNKH